jgi:hypothetical protein
MSPFSHLVFQYYLQSHVESALFSWRAAASRENAREAIRIFYNREVQDRLLEFYDEEPIIRVD